jgi:Tol biopolymer transport system component
MRASVLFGIVLAIVPVTPNSRAATAQATSLRVSSETPAWSPDGKRLAFSAGPPMQHQVYVIDADGTGAARLTEGPEQNRWPWWSPDGQSIVFMSDRDGQGELYVMRPDGSHQRRLTNTPVHEFAPAWSPRGDAIFYLAEMPGSKQQLWRMKPDGTNVQRVDGDHLYYGRGAWAADGSAFYIGANREANVPTEDRWKVRSRLYAFPAAGGEAMSLGPAGYASNPVPSPDGRSILFDTGDGASWSSAKGEWDLWIVDRLYRSTPRRLTSGSSNDWGAAWSADGARIAFSSGRDRVYALVVMLADGSGRKTLTQTDRLPR